MSMHGARNLYLIFKVDSPKGPNHDKWTQFTYTCHNLVWQVAIHIFTISTIRYKYPAPFQQACTRLSVTHTCVLVGRPCVLRSSGARDGWTGVWNRGLSVMGNSYHQGPGLRALGGVQILLWMNAHLPHIIRALFLSIIQKPNHVMLVVYSVRLFHVPVTPSPTFQP